MIEEKINQLKKVSYLDVQALIQQADQIYQDNQQHLKNLQQIKKVFNQIGQSGLEQQLIQSNDNFDQQSEQIQKLKRQINFCKLLQVQVNKVKQFLPKQERNLVGFLKTNEYNQSQLVIPFQEYYMEHYLDFNQEILQYVAKKIQEVQGAINEIYKNDIVSFLNEIKFPLRKQEEKIHVGNYSQQYIIDFIISISSSLVHYHKLREILSVEIQCSEQLIIQRLNQSCYFHFIDPKQPTSRSDKPEWFFLYLFEILQTNILELLAFDPNQENQLYQSAWSEFAFYLYDVYCLHNIQMRINADKEDFLENPEIALSFLESAQLFGMNIKTIFVDLQDFFDKVCLIFDEQGILTKVLAWESAIFERNLFSQMSSHLKTEKELDYKFTLYLNFIEDFAIMWKKLKNTFLGIDDSKLIYSVEDTYFKIFIQFLNLSQEFFKLIHYIKEESNKVTFLQTFAIGLDTLEAQFFNLQNYLKEIDKLRTNTIYKYIEKLQLKIADNLMKQIKNLLSNQHIQNLFQTREKQHYYQNQGHNFIEENQQMQNLEGAEQINRYHIQILQIVRSLIQDHITSKGYNLQITHHVVKALVDTLMRQFVELASSQLKFSYEGIKLYFSVIVKTTISVLITQVNLENSQFGQQILKKIDTIIQAVRQRGSPELEKSYDLNKSEVKWIQGLNIIFN